MKITTALTFLAASSLLSAAAITIAPTTIPSATVTRTISDSTTGTQGPQALAIGLISYQILNGGILYSYCLEPQQDIGPLGQNVTYEISPLSAGAGNIGGLSTTKVNQIRLLFGQFANPFTPSGITTLQQAALQVALWEIVRENSGTLNVTSGTTTFSNPSDASILTSAQALLNAVVAGTGTPNNSISALTNATRQDLIVRSSDVILPDAPIPEPVSTALVGTGIVGLGLARRYANRSKN